MPEYDKIVRDKIPELIKADGKKCEIHSVSEMDACVYLIDKLKEEADELLQALNYHSSMDELADLQEVIVALTEKQGWTMQQVEARRLSKRQERGGFENNIILLRTN